MAEPNAAHVLVIGGGLAGPEAAWQAASAGCRVTLCEMRPERMTPAHRSGDFAELVCSNSLRGASLEHAAGLLKEEMRRCGSLIMEAADANALPAGAALAVDRQGFSAHVRARLEAHPSISVLRREATGLPPLRGGREDGLGASPPVHGWVDPELPRADAAVIATGPLTAPALAAAIHAFLGEGYLSYFDAAAPIVTAESIDMGRVFRQSRYGKGDADYLNCPLTEQEYLAFRAALVGAEEAPLHDFEREGPRRFFEGCLPIEEMARRGVDTLRFGPLKPVGLVDPRTGRRPYAVVQLRRDNAAASHYNLVGFQTNLRWSEQRRVFRMIPGLERAEFARFGVMHRNLFLRSPLVLLPTLQARREERLFFAGQMTGVEGYVESAAGGLVAGINAARVARGEGALTFPPETALGALCRYITEADPDCFQPMNIAFGLLPAADPAPRDRRARRRAVAERALQALAAFRARHWPRAAQPEGGAEAAPGRSFVTN